MALLNARREWRPGLRATFCYGAHAGAASQLGYPPAAQFPLPADVPTLMLGGDGDGCIANSLHRYGLEAGALSASAMVLRSFEGALECNRDDSYLGILAGANHFALAWPEDSTTGRPFIDPPSTRPGQHLRRQLLSAISRFLRAGLHGDQRARAALERQLGNARNWSTWSRR